MKILKSICKALLFGSIFVCLLPVMVVNAVGTYVQIDNTCFYYEVVNGSYNYKGYVITNSNNARAVILRANAGVALYVISPSTFMVSNNHGGSACGTPNSVASYSNNYYYFRGTYANLTKIGQFAGNIPCIDVGNINNAAMLQKAIDYTYGPDSIDPIEPIDWGILYNPEYTTRIAGSGSAAKQNVDVIRWNNEIDTRGNDISECDVEIQAVPGSWSDSTLQGLLNKTLNDLDFTGVQPVTLDTVSASDGIFNVSWQSVVSSLNWVFDEYLYAREAQENLWKKYGWYYRIRLLSPDGYEGQWQTLYTPLSSSAQDSETVINHNSFDMSVNQVYQTITQLNNNTSVTIIYNDTDYTVQNPDNGTEPTGGTTLWDILKELLNGIFQILAKLGDIVLGLIDGLFDLFQSLFTPPEVDQTVNNDINLNINNYITESQPGLQDQQLHLHQIFSDLETISSSYSNGGDCILTWENVSMDLSVFNAGTVTFIPGGTYDFKAAFMQLLAGFGMTYATYQMLVSGVIYILLFVLISHKVKGFLKKT